MIKTYIENMKPILLLILAAVFTLSDSYAGVIVLEGHYQGKNLYVQNPFAGSGVGFCTFEVTVNGEVTTDEINSSAFEIDFTSRQLTLGESVIVKIKHKDDCKPKVLNPEVLKPKSTFDVEQIGIDANNLFSWKTSNETGKLTFVIEQYRWNKWVKVGEVEGKGSKDLNAYSFSITPHSGENHFRVKQVDYSGKPRYSPSAKMMSMKEEVTFSPIKVSKEIIFSNETLYEIYDSYGNIVKKGFGGNVDVSNLKKGIYYLNYDVKTEKFVKK